MPSSNTLPAIVMLEDRQALGAPMSPMTRDAHVRT
jgi:hypothetical protein